MSIPHGHLNRNARHAERKHPGSELNPSREQPKRKQPCIRAAQFNQ